MVTNWVWTLESTQPKAEPILMWIWNEDEYKYEVFNNLFDEIADRRKKCEDLHLNFHLQPESSFLYSLSLGFYLVTFVAGSNILQDNLIWDQSREKNTIEREDDCVMRKKMRKV